MATAKRRYGTGSVYIKHGSYYGQWRTAAGGRANRKLGTARRVGSTDGITRAEAERRLRELMAKVVVASAPDRTFALAAALHLEALTAKGRPRSHVETVESHVRVHLLPYFGSRPIDRLDYEQITRFVAA
jgi:hypothetical protein